MTRPLTIGIAGVSGAGKSSTLDALFRTRLAAGDGQSCPPPIAQIDLVVAASRAPHVVVLRVVDTPGIEAIRRQGEKFSRLYHTCLEECDVILWVMPAHQSALDLAPMHLQELPSCVCDRLVFGLNQVDRIEPMDWNDAFNIPSRRQEERLKSVVATLSASIYAALQRNPPLVRYSARRGYRLELLFHTLVEQCGDRNQWATAQLKTLSHQDLIHTGETNDHNR